MFWFLTYRRLKKTRENSAALRCLKKKLQKLPSFHELQSLQILVEQRPKFSFLKNVNFKKSASMETAVETLLSGSNFLLFVT